MKTFRQYFVLKEQVPVQPFQQTTPAKPGQPVQATVKPGQPVAQFQNKPGQPNQPAKPGQPVQQPNVDVKKLADTFKAFKDLLAPFGIK
jgi:hypothetical protein